MIVELGPEIKVWGVYPGGASGNPGSPNYDSMIESWRTGELYELRFYKEPPLDSDISLVQESKLLVKWSLHHDYFFSFNCWKCFYLKFSPPLVVSCVGVYFLVTECMKPQSGLLNWFLRYFWCGACMPCIYYCKCWCFKCAYCRTIWLDAGLI